MAKTLTDIARIVAKESGLSISRAEAAIKTAFSTIKAEVELDEVIQIRGFGTFKTRERAARKGRNPSTGAEIQIPASKAIVFKASKSSK